MTYLGFRYLNVGHDSFTVDVLEIRHFVIVLNILNIAWNVSFHLVANGFCNWMFTCLFSEIDHFIKECVITIGILQLEFLLAVDQIFDLWLA